MRCHMEDPRRTSCPQDLLQGILTQIGFGFIFAEKLPDGQDLLPRAGQPAELQPEHFNRPAGLAFAVWAFQGQLFQGGLLLFFPQIEIRIPH